MVTWNCLSMFSTRLTGSGAAGPCGLAAEEVGIPLDGGTPVGLARLVAEDITAVLSRVYPMKEFGNVETAGAKGVIEFIRPTSFLGGRG